MGSDRLHRTRRLDRFAALAALAVVACAAPPPARGPVVVSVPRSVCDGTEPAAPAEPSEMADSFDAFSRGWLEKLRRAATQRGTSSYGKRFSEHFETELRPTGSETTPYVGLLRYCEQRLRCADAAQVLCSLSSQTLVTEIFRYQGGQWVY